MKENEKDPKILSQKYLNFVNIYRIFDITLDNISKTQGLSKEDILKGNFKIGRRNIHDDISIAVVDLSKQAD